jgi:hypothetical protein
MVMRPATEAEIDNGSDIMRLQIGFREGPENHKKTILNTAASTKSIAR